MSYLDNVNRPRIALLDCDDAVRRSLEQAGYDVAVGYTGYFEEHPVADIPANLHEFELLVVDLDPGWTPRPGAELYPLEPEGPHSPPARGDHVREPRHGAAHLKRFEDALRHGAVLAVLMEGETQPLYVDENRSSPIRGGLFLWVPGSRSMLGFIRGNSTGVYTVGVSDDKLRIPDGDEADGLIELMRSQPGVKSLRTLRGCDHDLLVNAVGETKAGYVEASSQQGSPPGLVLFLPYFPKKAAALHRLLEYLSDRDPEMFPPREAVPWHDENAYQSPAVRRVREERDRRTREHDDALAALEEQEAEALEAQRALVPLFRGTGDDLARAASSALTSLGFHVVDADAARAASGDPRREDFVVSDPGDAEYIAVVEVTGGKGNAKQKDLTDLLLYRDGCQERRSDVGVQALLIVNQMVEVEPARRDEPFEHAQQTLTLAAAKAVTVISGWDLFNLTTLVLDGEVRAEDARELLKQPGLVSHEHLLT